MTNGEYLLSVPNLYIETFISCNIVKTRSSIRFSRCVPFPLVIYVGLFSLQPYRAFDAARAGFSGSCRFLNGAYGRGRSAQKHFHWVLSDVCCV